MFNKNRKRLLSAFIAAMMLCPVTTNGMEKNYNYKVITVNNYKVGVIPEFKNRGKAYVLWCPGTAFEEFSKKYEILDDENKEIYAGIAGVVAKCKNKRNGKIYAVKITMKNKPQQGNRNYEARKKKYDFRIQGLKNEKQFSEDAKKLWKNKTWATPYIDFFEDDNVAYGISEWVEGATIKEFLEMTKNDNVYKQTENMLKILERFNKILDDLNGEYCINYDLHYNNVILHYDDKKGEMFPKVIDNGQYEKKDKDFDFEIYNAQSLAWNLYAFATFINAPICTCYEKVREAGFSDKQILSWERISIEADFAYIYLKLKEIFSYLNRKFPDILINKDAIIDKNFKYTGELRKKSIETFNEMRSNFIQMYNSTIETRKTRKTMDPNDTSYLREK